jgi:hypothetical protein
LLPDQIKISDCVLNHVDTARILRKRGTPLQLLPFRGVIYITDNGENIWWSQGEIAAKDNSIKTSIAALFKKLYQFLITQPITQSIRDEFGLYTIDSM